MHVCVYACPGGKVREISREAHRRRGITRYLAQLRDTALFRACSRVRRSSAYIGGISRYTAQCQLTHSMKVINASAYGVYYMYTVPGESRMQTSHNDRAPYYSIYSVQVVDVRSTVCSCFM